MRPQKINRVDVYDRLARSEHTLTGKLTFSDGSEEILAKIPKDSVPLEVYFPAKIITWLKYEATQTTGTHPGLAEIKVYDADSKPNFHIHNSDSFWWGHMGLVPLWRLISPDVLYDFSQSWMKIYELDPLHRLPRGNIAGRTAWVMPGHQATTISPRRYSWTCRGWTKTPLTKRCEK